MTGGAAAKGGDKGSMVNLNSSSFDMQRVCVLLQVVLFSSIAISIFRIGLPILVDYPNHLARYWLLLGGAQDPALSRFYAVDWRRSSLIGVHLIGPLLGHVFPYTIVGKLIAFLALAGPPAGAVCLSWTVFGRWHWWQLSFPLLTWSTTGLAGFVAFQISVALALFFACVETYFPAAIARRLAIQIIFGSIILFVHPFGPGFYLLIILALMYGNSWISINKYLRKPPFFRNAIFSGLVIVVPVGCFLLLSPTPPGII